MNLGVHLPYKRLKTDNLLSAINYVQTPGVKKNVAMIAKRIISENGVENTINEIEKFLNI
jgi:UDP:flavonoid glycosyltransferase YjiC (YdhE family)